MLSSVSTPLVRVLRAPGELLAGCRLPETSTSQLDDDGWPNATRAPTIGAAAHANGARAASGHISCTTRD